MSKRIGLYPRARVEGGAAGQSCGPGRCCWSRRSESAAWNTAISTALAPWRKPRTVHGPGKVLLDVALGVALGGNCLADVAMLRAEPHVFGPAASAPTVSRLIDALAAAGPKALTAIRSARAEVRSRVWELAGVRSPAADGQVIVDIDGVPVLAHSDKQDATATWKKTFGHHPLVAFVDHGQAGSGEPVAALLRSGNAGSNHIATAQLALAQLPKHLRRGRQTLIRIDSAGGTHAFLDWLSKPTAPSSGNPRSPPTPSPTSGTSSRSIPPHRWNSRARSAVGSRRESAASSTPCAPHPALASRCSAPDQWA